MPRFDLVDVFHDGPLSGNPVAVLHDATSLSTETMQAITRWLNLSESTFLLPPTDARADYRVRIFTLDRELPFAGHPTLGTAHAWLAAGGTPRDPAMLVQQCEAGLVRVRRSAAGLAFAAPPLIRTGPVEEELLHEIVGVLRIARADIVDAAWVDNGPGWVAVRLASAEAVLAVEPARGHPRRIEIGLVGFYPPGSSLAYEVRALFSDAHGALIEDPVTGSLNASLAQWLIGSGAVTPPYTAGQGARLGRAGRITIDCPSAADVWVGGRTTVYFTGDWGGIS